jgi:hypothetical protein
MKIAYPGLTFYHVSLPHSHAPLWPSFSCGRVTQGEGVSSPFNPLDGSRSQDIVAYHHTRSQLATDDDGLEWVRLGHRPVHLVEPVPLAHKCTTMQKCKG